jgi:type I restriction enzyme M protein
MNLLLHGIGTPTGESLVTVADALRADPGVRTDMIAANPPFGRKSSMTMVNEAGEIEREDLVVVRDDFWASTSNKQLNFLQHIKGMLRIGGRAAVVLPDNVLFEAGAGETIRRRLLAECDLHTILRLPTGIFYAQGVKANVVFFDRKPAAADPWTKETWVYDLRTNQHFTLKTNPLREADLAEFVEGFCADDRSKRVESERFRRFTYDELVARDKANLDITWLRDESLDDASTLSAPAVLAAEIVEELEAALAQFSELAASLPSDESGAA